MSAHNHDDEIINTNFNRKNIVQAIKRKSERDGWKHKIQIAIEAMKHYSSQKPFRGQLVSWKEYDVVLVKQVRIKEKVAKVIPVHFDGCSTMPFEYYWVDFSEIGF